ncbi:hypothetical protein CHS0354_032808 [Potamilus streckersoni]|uniref:Uncharacterized protein n=1 Tax=Potamilus streckersoni TaxID=2493646 RepID=A0AAE0S946_9BIVA|nr:hypothetical protein CHS0354_032808 [Potamilus streckersoni]
MPLVERCHTLINNALSPPTILSQTALVSIIKRLLFPVFKVLHSLHFPSQSGSSPCKSTFDFSVTTKEFGKAIIIACPFVNAGRSQILESIVINQTSLYTASTPNHGRYYES